MELYICGALFVMGMLLESEDYDEYGWKAVPITLVAMLMWPLFLGSAIKNKTVKRQKAIAKINCEIKDIRFAIYGLKKPKDNQSGLNKKPGESQADYYRRLYRHNFGQST